MKYIIWADTHYYSKQQYKIPMAVMFEEAKKDNCYILGDAMDKASCKKSEAEEVFKKVMCLKHIAGYRYVTGNHDGFIHEENLYTKHRGILFCHGHHLLYSNKKRLKWLNKRPGRSELSRNAVNLGHKLFHRFKPDCYSKWSVKRKKDKFLKLMNEEGCHTLVMGHMHMHKLTDFKMKGKRIIMLKIGRTEIEL